MHCRLVFVAFWRFVALNKINIKVENKICRLRKRNKRFTMRVKGSQSSFPEFLGLFLLRQVLRLQRKQAHVKGGERHETWKRLLWIFIRCYVSFIYNQAIIRWKIQNIKLSTHRKILNFNKVKSRWTSLVVEWRMIWPSSFDAHKAAINLLRA